MSQFVSIVMPTLNGSQFISSSVESILQQSYTDFELIIIDDGSTDNTLEIISKYKDPRIKIYSQPRNTGRLPGVLNFGFAKACGEYLTWASDDDLHSPEAIESMVTFLDQNPKIGLVYCGYYNIDINGKVINESVFYQPSDIIYTNPVGFCFLYRLSTAQEVGLFYDENWFMVEDYEYWVRIYKYSNMALIRSRLYYHRLHSNSLTGKNYGGYLAMRLSAKVRREKLGISHKNYLFQVSDAYIQEGFAAYNNCEYLHAKKCLINGVIRNPLWLSNKGILSIMFKPIQSLH